MVGGQRRVRQSGRQEGRALVWAPVDEDGGVTGVLPAVRAVGEVEGAERESPCLGPWSSPSSSRPRDHLQVRWGQMHNEREAAGERGAVKGRAAKRRAVKGRAVKRRAVKNRAVNGTGECMEGKVV